MPLGWGNTSEGHKIKILQVWSGYFPTSLALGSRVGGPPLVVENNPTFVHLIICGGEVWFK
jgi:hypothetical protein